MSPPQRARTASTIRSISGWFVGRFIDPSLSRAASVASGSLAARCAPSKSADEVMPTDPAIISSASALSRRFPGRVQAQAPACAVLSPFRGPPLMLPDIGKVVAHVANALHLTCYAVGLQTLRVHPPCVLVIPGYTRDLPGDVEGLRCPSR